MLLNIIIVIFNGPSGLDSAPTPIFSFGNIAEYPSYIQHFKQKGSLSVNTTMYWEC